MRVAFFVNDFPSLTQTFVMQQIAGVIEAGHDVTVIAVRKTVPDVPNPLVTNISNTATIHYLPDFPDPYWKRVAILGRLAGMKIPANRFGVILRALNPLRFGREAGSLRLLYRCLPFLEVGSFDILHCQFGMLGQMVAQLREIGAVSGKLITAFRGYDTEKYLTQYPGAYDELFDRGDLFLPVIKGFRSWLIDKGCPEEKIEVLHSGINLDKFEYHARKRDDGQPVRLLSVCRLVEKKGIAYAISSVADMVRDSKMVQYTIIGDGPLRPALEQQIDEMALTDHVHLLGSLPHTQVLERMQQSDILVAPSVTASDGDMEGIPNVLKEAMASGMPVVATCHSGIPELVKDGVTGYLIPERDSDALTQALTDLAGCAEKWERIGRAGRAMTIDAFDIDNLNRRLIGLYSSLLAKL